MKIEKNSGGWTVTNYLLFHGEELPFLRLRLNVTSDLVSVEFPPECLLAKPTGRQIRGVTRQISDFREGDLEHLSVLSLRALFDTALLGEEAAKQMLIQEIFGGNSDQLKTFLEIQKQAEVLQKLSCWY
jgi:hypothetical protein